jgi:uncharacterized protein YbjT (DUF2867 family)
VTGSRPTWATAGTNHGHHSLRQIVGAPKKEITSCDAGASGWIGSAAVDELLGAGHDVVGLARSDASTASLEAKGAQGRRGDLDDLDSIRAGAQDADAVVHLANKHDFENPEASNKAERDAVDAIGAVLAGSNRPFLLASGVTGVAQGRAGPRPSRTRPRSTARTHRAAEARTSPSSTCSGACTP